MESTSGSLIAVITIARGAALLVLATEAIILWSQRAAKPSGAQPQTLSRFVWAATPAALLAGLSLWCMSTVAPARDTAPAFALRAPTTHDN